MSILRNLARIVEAPIKVIDKTILEPIAYVADEAAKGFTADEDDNRK